MKKLLSLALVLSLMFVSLCSFPVSAASTPSGLDDPANWIFYSNNVGIGTTATISSWGSVTKNTNTSKTYGGDASSLRFSAYTRYASVKLDVKPNTAYTFTYYMMYDGTNSTDKILSHSAIVSAGGTADWGKDGCYDIYTSVGSARCDSGLWANVVSTTNIRGKVTQWQEGGKWHKVNHSFNSGNNEQMYFVFRFAAANNNNFYVDELQLKEVSSFEDLSNWGVYQTSSSDANYNVVTSYDGSGQTASGWLNIKKDTTVDADGTGSSIRVNGSFMNVAAEFPTLKANTNYTLSFKYKPSSTSTTASAGTYFTSHIIKKGTAISSSGPAEYVAVVPSGTATTDWKDISVSFATDDTTDYMLEFRFVFGAGYVCNLDDFVLTEILPPPVHPQVDDWNVYSMNTTYVNETDGVKIANDWTSVTTCTDETFINDGDESSLKIHSLNQYATYKFPVEKNAKYTVSYNFISETANTNGYIIERTGVLAADSSIKWAAENGYYSFTGTNMGYIAKNGIYSGRTSHSKRTTSYAATNTWHHIDLEFESGNNEYMYLVIRSAVEDMYVDSVEVTLNERNVVKVTTAYNNAAALRTASASSTGKNGLRVYNSIAKDYLSSNSVIEYGSIATRKELLGSAELTVNSANIVKGIAYNSTTQTTPILFDKTDDANIFTAYLTNIPTNRYDEEYVVRAYVIDSEGNVYYGDTATVCVFDITYAIDCGNSADGSAPSETDIAAFEAFANYDGSYVAYDAWLAANGLAAGSLRNSAK